MIFLLWNSASLVVRGYYTAHGTSRNPHHNLNYEDGVRPLDLRRPPSLRFFCQARAGSNSAADRLILRLTCKLQRASTSASRQDSHSGTRHDLRRRQPLSATSHNTTGSRWRRRIEPPSPKWVIRLSSPRSYPEILQVTMAHIARPARCGGPFLWRFYRSRIRRHEPSFVLK